MLRVYTDYQALIDDNTVWILRYKDGYLEDYIQELKLHPGDKIILDAHENFDVVGTLEHRYIDILKRTAWVAVLDWSTQRDKQEGENPL